MTNHLTDDWGEGGTQVEEDLNELGMSVKVAGEEDDLEETEGVTEEGGATVVASPLEDEDEPLDGLARLDALERDLDVVPIDIEEEE